MIGKHESWWAPVWRGLVADPDGKHVRRLDGAVWLFLYFILHAKRDSGIVWAKTANVGLAMGVPRRTVQRWLRTLIEHGYVVPMGKKGVQFLIPKWRTLRGAPRPAPDHASISAERRQPWRAPIPRKISFS